MRISLSNQLFSATAVVALAASTTGTLADTRSGDSLFGVTSAGITYGPYVRAELGGIVPVYDNAFWLPPGYDEDPQVFFDLSGDNTLGGSVAVGMDYMNGFRWDVSLTMLGEQAVTGPWSYTVPETDGPHASIDATFSSTALMISGFYSPLEHQGKNSKVQPFLTAGVGIASNAIGDWTRINLEEDPEKPDRKEYRTFEGASTSSFAWTIGGGIAWEVGDYQSRPVLLDVTYRYTDLGEARGGTTPVPGTDSGRSEPVQALTFNTVSHSVMFGLRMPLQSY